MYKNFNNKPTDKRFNHSEKCLTADVVLCTVQHVGCVDELVACTADTELCLGVTQNYFTPVTTRHLNVRTRTKH